MVHLHFHITVHISKEQLDMTVGRRGERDLRARFLVLFLATRGPTMATNVKIFLKYFFM